MIIYESMNQLLYLLGKNGFKRTKCPRVPILKYVVSFRENKAWRNHLISHNFDY